MIFTSNIIVSDIITDYEDENNAAENRPAAQKHMTLNYLKATQNYLAYYYKTVSPSIGNIILGYAIIKEANPVHVLSGKYNGLCADMESAGILKERNKMNIALSAIKTIGDFKDKSAVVTMLRNQSELTDNPGILDSEICRRSV